MGNLNFISDGLFPETEYTDTILIGPMHTLPVWIKCTLPLIAISTLLLILWFSVRRPYTLTIRIADGQMTILEHGATRLAEHPLPDLPGYSSATISVIHDRDALLLAPFIPTTVSVITKTSETTERMFPAWQLFLSGVREQFSFSRIPFTSKNLDEDSGIRQTAAIHFAGAAGETELRLDTINPKEIRIEMTDTAGLHTAEVWVRPKTHHDGYLNIDGQSYDLIAPVNKRTGFYATVLLSFAARTLLTTAILWTVCVVLRRKKQTPWVRRLESLPIPRYMVWCTGIIATACAAWIALFILEGVPHTQDEVAYLFQARNFAQGKLYALSFPPPVHRFFDHEFIINNGKWFGKYPPLHSLLLAAGELFSFPALMNPLMMVGNGLLLFAIARRALPPLFALITMALFLFSPFSLLIHASFFSHPLALLLTLLGIRAMMGINEQPRHPLQWILLGISVGLLSLTRPANAAVVVCCFLPIGIPLVRTHLRQAGISIAIILFFQALGAGYNALLTGNPLQSPRQLYSAFDTLGFGLRGAEPWGMDFTISDAVANLTTNTQSLLHMAYLWPPVFTLAFIPFAWMGRFRRFSLWLTWCAAVHAGIYFFYFHEGAFYGPRYWFEISWIWSLLTIMGIVALWHRYRTPAPWILFFVLALYGSVSTYTILGKFRGVNDIRRPYPPVFSHPAVVFIDGHDIWQNYGQFFLLMRDPHRDPVVYVRSEAAYNADSDQQPLPNTLLRSIFPDRALYRYENGEYIPLSDTP